jgi:hypothetical protein
MTTDLVQQLLDYPNHLKIIQQSLDDYRSKPYVTINPFVIQVSALLARCSGPLHHIHLEKISADSKQSIDYLLSHARLLLENPLKYKQYVYQSTVANYLEQIAHCQKANSDKCESVRQIMDVDYKPNYPKYDFSFIIDNWDRKAIESHWKIVQDLKLEPFFKSFIAKEYNDLCIAELNGFNKCLLELEYSHNVYSLMNFCNKMHNIALDWDGFVESYLFQYAEVLDDLSKNMRCLQIY